MPDISKTPMNAPAHKTLFRRRALVLAVLACAASLSLFASAQPAAAEVNLCQSAGSGAGQCSNAKGIAASFETNRVYVADQGNNRVDVFEADGDFLFAFGWGVADGTTSAPQTCTATCFKGIAGTGAGQFDAPKTIAIDNTGGPNQGDVYVGTDNFRVQRFKADGSFVNSIGSQGSGECQISATNDQLAVGPGGNVFVADNSGSEPDFISRVETFSPAGTCLGETVLLKGNSRIRSLAVDAAEDAFIAAEGLGGLELRKYDLGTPETKLCDLDPGIETKAVALDATGHLFAEQREKRVVGGVFQVITEYDVTTCPPSKHVRRFGYGQILPNIPDLSNVAGIAALHSLQGDVFASEESGGQIPYVPFPKPGPIVAPESLEVPEATRGNVRATVRAEVNPEGKETSVRVEYVEDGAFQEDVGNGGDGFEGPGTKVTETKALGMAAGPFRVNAIEFQLGCPVASQQLIEEGKCLNPKTEHHWRAVATNADNPSGEEEGTAQGPVFETKEPLEIEQTWASEVGPDAARLNTVLNPLGIPTTGYFEYVDDAKFKSSEFAEAIKVPNVDAEAQPLDFGSGEAGVKRSVLLSPLKAGTTYHYRLVATDTLIEPTQVFSEAESFKTFLSAEGEPCSANEDFRTGTGALLPDCRAYELVSPLDKSSGDIAVLNQFTIGQPAVVSQSAVAGGRLTYGSYRAFGDAKSAPTTIQYLSERNPPGSPNEGWQAKAITPPYGHSVIGAAEFDYEFKAFSDDLCESWLIPLFEPEPPLTEDFIPTYKNLYRRNDGLCGEEGYETLSTAKPENIKPTAYLIELQGISANGATVAFAANDSLEESGAFPQPPGCAVDASNCGLRLYVKESGVGPRSACVLPGGAAHPGACSAGTGTVTGFSFNRVANVQNALSADGKRLFWTDSAAEGAIYLRENPLAEGPECAEAASPCTIAVSKEAEEDTGEDSHFWAAAEDGSPAIFSSGEGLYEFEVATKTTTPIAGGFKGVLGVSEDAARLYFASDEALAPGASAGKANLYLREAGAGSRFIAVLADGDVGPGGGSNGGSSATAPELRFHNGRVSADGLHAAFMSQAPITGYDNTDVSSAVECGKSKGAVKGICDTEIFLYDATAKSGAGELLCVSCNPSGGRPVGRNLDQLAPFWIAGRLPFLQNVLYHGRAMAEDGSRLFFESVDPLVGRDTNGRIDVYQWERAGRGGCEEADVAFVSSAGGCIDLISTGQSGNDSGFLDADPSGENAFFTTLEGLVSPDYGLIDVYDARVGGGFPPPPPEAPECEGESCQHPAAAPEFGTPATSSAGPGDPVARSRRQARCPKGKRRARKGGKTRCLPRKAKRKAAAEARSKR